MGSFLCCSDRAAVQIHPRRSNFAVLLRQGLGDFEGPYIGAGLGLQNFSCLFFLRLFELWGFSAFA